ncbi:DUF6069 family protein [Amycolatopsis sp. NPDC021455]|uniref:DUF6069 family protein n=1 Tax=Amycolatopsis sp. NPDC021455 TaxID=3154901 RepID=UPI0033E1FD31
MTTATTRTSTLALRLGLAAVAALAVNTAIALAASALDDGGLGIGLAPVAYLPATLAGLLAGAAGWRLIVRRAPRAARALRVIVPAVLVLTWIPDLLLLTVGATAANVVGLMLMHTAVTTAVVTAMRPTLPRA